jgi:hypothetical protein
MELLRNIPIGIRESSMILNRSQSFQRKIRISQKDRIRKKITFNYPAFHMWFRFLKLSLELEELGYSIPKRGAHGKVLEGGTKIVVDREFYAGWNSEEVLEGKWNSWCRKEMRDQLIEMGVKPMGKPQYDSLSKRYNVYVRYFNANPQTYEERTNLSMDLINRLEKVRFERVSRDTNKSLSEYTKLIWKEVKAAEATILNVMSGQFP